MKTIELTSYKEFQELWSRLRNLLPEKALQDRWCSPPVEYKSSPYRVWCLNGARIDSGNGGYTVGYRVYFRDERDYIAALLLK